MKIYRGFGPHRIQLRTTSNFRTIKTAHIYLPASIILRFVHLISVPFLRLFQKGSPVDSELVRILEDLNLSEWKNLTIIKSSFSGRSICSVEMESCEIFVIKFGPITDQGIINEINFYQYSKTIGHNANLLEPLQSGFTSSHAFLVFPQIRKSFFKKANLQDWGKIKKTLIALDVEHHDLAYWNVLISRNSEMFLIDWELWGKGKNLHNDLAYFKKSIHARRKFVPSFFIT
jgi:hypothetical protein